MAFATIYFQSLYSMNYQPEYSQK